MANSPRINDTVANLMLEAAFGGTILNSGKLLIYDGSQPASGGGSAAGCNLLAQLTLAASSPMQAAATHAIAANAITQDSSADATGTATWFRLTTSADVFKLDGSVGTASCDLNLNSTSIQLGGTVSCTSFTITMPIT